MKKKHKPNLLQKYGKYFSDIIKDRGRDYYQSNNVIICQKINNKYTAKIKGSNHDYHKVTIEFIDDDIDMTCSCPCDFKCKHEYATLIRMKNHDYQTVRLKPKISRKKEPLNKTLEKIPAEELKEYLCQNISNLIDFDKTKFEKKFSKYMPCQSYNYYYNNLYNAIVLNEDYGKLANQYKTDIICNVVSHKYRNVFTIIKAIVNALHHTKNLDSFDSFKFLESIRVFLYSLTNNNDKSLIKDVKSWYLYLKKNRYFGSFVLESFIKFGDIN